MDRKLAQAYLDRIGAAWPAAADADALRELQIAHLRAVPFENLSIHLGEPISLAMDQLLDKIVTRRRGGFCYEVNGAFGWLLRQLGFDVTILGASVYNGTTPGPPFDHLTLRVDAEQPWLADVGFGSFSHHPLRWNETGPQTDPAGSYRLRPEANGDITVLENDWPEYRIETRPRRLSDFEPTCLYQQKSPRSHFTRSLTCSRLTDNGRITLSSHTLTHTVNGNRTQTRLESDAEILAAYQDHFGIRLPRPPTDPKQS
ncbi:MAG: arylamine N-acetyltransferase family protein [Stackebrandtia sp.]